MFGTCHGICFGSSSIGSTGVCNHEDKDSGHQVVTNGDDDDDDIVAHGNGHLPCEPCRAPYSPCIAPPCRIAPNLRG